MYIANKTFTSKHHHDYVKGQRITNARYFFLAMEDKQNFDYHLHGDYTPEEENDPNFGHNPGEHYYQASDVTTHAPVAISASAAEDEHIHKDIEDDDSSLMVGAVIGTVLQEMIDQSPGPSFDPTPTDIPTIDTTADFGGGSGGGGGAGDSW